MINILEDVLDKRFAEQETHMDARREDGSRSRKYDLTNGLKGQPVNWIKSSMKLQNIIIEELERTRAILEKEDRPGGCTMNWRNVW